MSIQTEEYIQESRERLEVLATAYPYTYDQVLHVWYLFGGDWLAVESLLHLSIRPVSEEHTAMALKLLRKTGQP